MKYRFKIFVIVLTSLTILIGGVCLSYYNTKKFGFDENAKIISRDDEKISVMDFDFYYKDLNQYVEKIHEFMPDTPYSVCTFKTGVYNVY